MYMYIYQYIEQRTKEEEKRANFELAQKGKCVFLTQKSSKQKCRNNNVKKIFQILASKL